MPAFLIVLWAKAWFRKAVLYAVIALAVLYGFHLWLNRHDTKVYQQGRESMAVELEKTKKAEWEAKGKSLEEQARLLDLKAAEITRDRQSLTRTLDDRLRSIQTYATANTASVAAVSDSGLDAALRAVSRELAAQP